MKSLSQLSDHALEHEFGVLVARDRTTTAALLRCLAEIDRRKLYRPAAYSSLFAYCVGKFRMSEDVAYKRIRAARAARRFPAILRGIAEGELHLSGVVLLAPHLTVENVQGLLEAAVHKSFKEIEQLVAERFPRPDVPTFVRALPLPAMPASPVPVVAALEMPPVAELAARPVVGPVQSSRQAPPPVPVPVDRSRVQPLAPRRYALQLTMDQEMHDLLRQAQDLMGHHGADPAQVLRRALKELVAKLEREKFAASDRPRQNGATHGKGRHVPAQVKREVWKRDGGRCTFVSDQGKRCEARSSLEFDHIDAVARGGEASINTIRLRCRAHNQYEAEQSFGAEFMRRKREGAREARGQSHTWLAPAP